MSVGLSVVGVQAARADGHDAGKGVAPPKPWTVHGLNAMALEDLGDIDWTPVESGVLGNSESTLFEGDNTVAVWDAGPAKLTLEEPLPYDEFVVVLEGELVLTDDSGHSMTYKAGDMFMLPKGFKGTWDMTQSYRELIVVDTQAYNEE
ncbi:MAG: cupin domain-containing protein [Pseudomonadota bacterium]